MQLPLRLHLSYYPNPPGSNSSRQTVGKYVIWWDLQSSACGAHHVPESNSPWFELPNIPARLNTLYQIPLKAYKFPVIAHSCGLLTTHRNRAWKAPEYTFLCLVVFSAAANLFIFHFLSGGCEESRIKSHSASLSMLIRFHFPYFWVKKNHLSTCSYSI